MEILHNLSGSVESFTTNPSAILILAIWAFAESTFFPIPPDIFLVTLSLANPAGALFYAFVTTISSVTGGMCGYFIGQKGGKPLLAKVAHVGMVNLVRKYYQKHDALAVGIGAFTPIPYKVFTIAAGVFDLNFQRFILFSFLGRSGRFFLIGILIWIFGPMIKDFLNQYFELIVITFSLILVSGFVLFGIFTKHKRA